VRKVIVALALVAILVGLFYLVLATSIPGVVGTGPHTAKKPETKHPYTRVEVFFATDREPAGTRAGIARYNPKWSPRLEYGRAEVSIPHDHRVGRIESPSVWRLEFRPDPRKHIVLQSAERLGGEAFKRVLKTSVDRSGKREILVFIHGFNVSYEGALMRTAQIAYDLQLPGVPVTYTWPSLGQLNPVAYVADGNMADVTVPHLKTVLTQLARDSGATRVHVVAHSMGNKVLARALDAISADNAAKPRPHFNNIALTAPDIDENVMTDIAARVYPLADRITLYASNNARRLSSQVATPNRVARAKLVRASSFCPMSIPSTSHQWILPS
jgi:esterase/lipase superfamily enzyme